jgi:hypothetical protein
MLCSINGAASNQQPIENSMRVEIDNLTEAELIDLNNRVVERLRFMAQARSHTRMLQFKIGDRVSFEPDGRGVVNGILTRYNKKSVTVISDTGQRWNVAPQLLHRVIEGESRDIPDSNVVAIRKK